MKKHLPELGSAIRITMVVMVVTGLIYPLAVTGIAQALLHDHANGSLVTRNGEVIGSGLIGQNFTSDKYFHGRPSSTVDASGTPQPYNAANSSASNLGPTNPALILAVQRNADAVRCSEGLAPGPPPIVTPEPSATPEAGATPALCAPLTQAAQEIPVDAVTTSGSGLDPDISVAYALLQVSRVARAHKLPPEQVQKLVEDHITGRQLGLLGEPRVNVLELNLALDDLDGKR